MESFVYKWTNVNNGKEYIGYHKGHINDGYISSSRNITFWDDYNKGELKRTILFEGSTMDCIEFESRVLRDADFDKLYNRNKNGKIIFTDDVLEKMRIAGKGRKQSADHIAARSVALKGRKGGFKGKQHSEETIAKMKSWERTDEQYKKISDALRGREGSFKGKSHTKLLCPHCNREIATNMFSRWHGDNCKGRK